ncbi:Tex family protein [Nitratidesulfovibrio vulgaris]|uniref:RNA binding S1 domain protein n=1 Tax=Nitratidesulfovibrio vulgaris (strain DP4) TaxID=391774 RepID=A0A0H3A783_NITV4|nr:Tex family protein [Nitratidesulfovibrio vulgaris]ABM28016.1 RNA binding S1 domain protein [Nitratidesulfovibrio vulgaris DP4]GEB80594.1 RNA-binding transcriptional accessory protein [Desulfovibrio desulfuricans]
MTETIPHDSVAHRLAADLGITTAQASAALKLFDEGGTIPFVARYRKEATGGLDEVALTALRDGCERLRTLDKRRDAIITSMTEREQLTPDLAKALHAATTLTALEDIYLPFRPKRVTRAAKARERGLAPLAERLLEQRGAQAGQLAAPFVDEAKGVPDTVAALAGARDIIAETVSEDRATRATLRDIFVRRATLRSKVARGKEEQAATYRDHFDRSEHAAAAPAHRLLAMFRGEREELLDVRVRPDDDLAVGALHRRWLKGRASSAGTDAAEVATALTDAWNRLLAPSLENEFRTALRERAEAEAIAVFAANLRELLLAPPMGPRRTLALDPGWRTGAKLVCLDAQGALLHHEVIHPLTGGDRATRAAATLRELCSRHGIEAVAVGNGTAGRETEAFVKSAGLPPHVTVALVDERGASVYSASEVARAEFPDHDVTVRGAVSIGRRLMDPLAELVKVDPRSLGVGQYQHDVDQNALRRALEEVVASCVNAVGVDVNTASPELLAYVSGIGPALAKGIVAWRAANGPFRTRRELLKVPRLGPKAFEQAAGFLRVHGGPEPLDASAVHPESYALVRRMAEDTGCSVPDLMRDAARREALRLERYVDDRVGLPTLHDIMSELARPGRDPRPAFEVFAFAEGVNKVDDVQPGMELPGIVTNVTKFGAFVDIGVHRDGLVHVSQLADRFVRDPAEVVAPGRKVRVRVLDVDRQRERINLTLKGVPQQD